MLDTGLIKSIPELLHRQADERGDKVAFSDAHGSVTYAQLLHDSGNLAGHLITQGLEAGDSVAIWLPNSVAWVESCFATLRAGGVAVPISYDSTEPEVRYRLEDAQCRILITTDERAAMLAAGEGGIPEFQALILVERGERYPQGHRHADQTGTAPAAAPPDPAEIDQPSFIVYTSGTTGLPKGVLLSVRGMLWVTAACWAPITGLSASDRVLSPLPLFHSHALNLSVLSIVAVGASEHIMERYSTDEALELLGGGGFTFFPGVPTMFHYLLQAARAAGRSNFPDLRVCVSAGAIMPATLNQEFEAHFGVKLLDGYGITETSTMVTMNWPSGTRTPGSCGLPVPGLATRIIDPASGADVARGDEGELIVRGPNLMAGYHRKPEETAKAVRDGWYHTGDLARSDANGFLQITGRLKELIIRGGQNIAPAEIEEVVMTFEGIGDCAVVGLAHDDLGEVPVVFIVEKPDATIDAAELIEHCRRQLSAYKVPDSVHLTDVIPRTGSGKTIRYKLAESLAS